MVEHILLVVVCFICTCKGAVAGTDSHWKLVEVNNKNAEDLQSESGFETPILDKPTLAKSVKPRLGESDSIFRSTGSCNPSLQDWRFYKGKGYCWNGATCTWTAPGDPYPCDNPNCPWSNIGQCDKVLCDRNGGGTPVLITSPCNVCHLPYPHENHFIEVGWEVRCGANDCDICSCVEVPGQKPRLNIVKNGCRKCREPCDATSPLIHNIGETWDCHLPDLCCWATCTCTPPQGDRLSSVQMNYNPFECQDCTRGRPKKCRIYN